MSKRKYTSEQKRERVLKIIAVILAFVILVCGVLFGINLWETGNGKNLFQNEQILSKDVLEYEGKEYVLKENVETILILGLDKFVHSGAESYDNNMQADFLILMVIDNDAKTCAAVHINRDTIAEMSVLGVAGDKIDVVNQQIALAHTYGNGKEVSCRNTTEAVENILMGVDIDHYVSVTMDAVSGYNDLLGGVEVTVLDDFTGIDDTLIKDEVVNLKGEHALNYVRTRYGLEDSSNSNRMVRQKQYLEALYDKTKIHIDSDDEFIVNAATQLSSHLVSDCSANRLQTLAEKVVGYEFTGIYDFDGETKMGEKYLEFYPDEKSVEEIVVKLFYTPRG